MKTYKIKNDFTSEYEYYDAESLEYAQLQLELSLANRGYDDSLNELESDWNDYYDTLNQAVTAHVENFVSLRLLEYGKWEEVK